MARVENDSRYSWFPKNGSEMTACFLVKLSSKPPTVAPLCQRAHGAWGREGEGKRKEEKERERQRERQTKRERNVYFPHSFVTPTTLRGNEGSPATFTVLGACGYQLLPLLPEENPSPTPWAWLGCCSGALSVHSHAHFSVSGSLETKQRDTRGEKND